LLAFECWCSFFGQIFSIGPSARYFSAYKIFKKLAQLCVPAMEKQGYGRVVFCSSIAAGTGVPPAEREFYLNILTLATGGVVGPHYSSSKSAMHGIMHWIARQYVRSGIVCDSLYLLISLVP
jgi:NAD(P)-dependent dehydrogenase (short-subunit alcohol dehydrogenase family)